MHELEFFDFCNGQKDVCHPCPHLQLKPGLDETVLAKFPSSARIDSSLPLPNKTKKQQTSPDNKHSIVDAMKEMRPIVVDNECKKIKCDCLLRDDRRKEHREMVTDHEILPNLSWKQNNQ